MVALAQRIGSISAALVDYRNAGCSVFATSSFQTHSLPMLHILRRHSPEIPVVFLDTGFHFAETLAFRDEMAARLDLNLVNIEGLARDRANPLYISSPTDCCARNKVEPLEPVLRAHDVWISGVRAGQTHNRSGFTATMPGPYGIERFHPMLDWTDEDIHAYRTEHDLPEHPLDRYGFTSVGCAPCTSVPTTADQRSGRWLGSEHTECGLHLEPALGA